MTFNFWHNRNVDDSFCPRSGGWNRLWRMNVPHKLKVLLWRFCRNNLPIRNQLRFRGIPITIMCLLCAVDVEHLLHVFFDCTFAKACWQAAGLGFDMSQVSSPSEWLLNILETSNHDENMKIAIVLWEIWF